MHSEINTTIKEALAKSEGVNLSNYHEKTKEQQEALHLVEHCAHKWLTAQQKQIEDQASEINRLREREYNHYPMVRMELESRAMNAEAQLNLAINSLEEIRRMEFASIGHSTWITEFIDQSLSEINKLGGNQ